MAVLHNPDAAMTLEQLVLCCYLGGLLTPAWLAEVVVLLPLHTAGKIMMLRGLVNAAVAQTAAIGAAAAGVGVVATVPDAAV